MRNISQIGYLREGLFEPGRQLAFLHGKGVHHLPQLGGDQHSAVVQGSRSAFEKGVGAELAACDAQVVSSAGLRLHAEDACGHAHHAQLPRDIKEGLGQDKREVEAAHVLIHGAAAAEPAADKAVFGGKIIHGRFVPRVLGTAEHHGRAVLPHQKDGRVFRQGIHQVFFQRLIAVRIAATGDQAGCASDHRSLSPFCL